MATDKIGRNQTFPIYNADGSSFQNLVLKKSVVDSVVMSLSDKITGDVYYKSNNLVVTMQEYIEYKRNPNDENEDPVRYVLVTPPTIVRNGIVSDNSELKGMTKYSFVFYHPMYQLSNLPFGDVAVTQSEERYLSENKVFSWIGYPNDFIAKLNSNLDGTQWICERSSNFPSGKDTMLSSVLSFNNNTIADALKTWYDTWEIPYVIDQVKSSEQSYASGKRFKVVLGLPDNEIYEYSGGQPTQERYIFKMGKGLGLKNNSVTPKNNKIVTRISGCGSEDNIPYGYPQIIWYGEQGRKFTYGDSVGTYTNVTIDGHTYPKIVSYPIYKGIVGGMYVELIQHPFTRTNLMPSIYRTTLFNKISFLNSNGTPNTNYNPDITLVDSYDAIPTEQYPYVNEINADAPSYEFHEFEEIKPELGEETLVGVTPIDKELQPVQDWDDTMDEDGNHTQRYFRVTLPQLSFDIYACAAITQEMQINMRSGACIGCTFPVMVDWESYKANFYDENGDFAPTGSQRDYTLFPDSSQGSINLILQKETSTFGTLMPNVYQNPHSGDQFVVLGISLPLSYITNAESRLDAEMKSYMLLNNIHYYEYPLKFDEYFFANRTEILQQIHPNSIIRFEYNGSILELYVKQLTIKFGESPLPQYDITLTDNIEVVSNPIGKVSENVDKLATLVAITQNNQKYGSGGSGSGGDGLSRTHDDIAQGEITFLKGIKIGLLKLFGWDSKGNIKVNNTKVEGNLDVNGNAKFKKNVEIDGLLSSLKAKINQLYSWNYSGSGIFESGWLLTNDHNGHSYLEVDELLVRMKAVFMELEIRKETYSGGNVFYSPAGSVIYRVEPQNASNEPMGQHTVETVKPWSWGERFLGLFGLTKIGLLGHTHTITVQDEVDPSLVHHYRCYLIADNGTTQTRNWWHVGDQARCQTFNRASEKQETDHTDQVNPNFDNNYIQRNMDGNRFFWRLVKAVGSTKLEDGKWYDYVDLANTEPNNGYVSNSDVPVSGDSIVCIGNRSDAERMNMIMLEVIGDDAPAIKIYKGINSFSFEGRKYMCVSPRKIQLRSGSIEYISDNGMELPPKIYLGSWKSGYRYHYYEEVSNNGSTWLCIVTDGYHWETASGTTVETPLVINAGEGLFTYGQDSQGNDLKDRYYATSTLGDGTIIYKVRNYTTTEPSDSNVLWENSGGSGTKGSFKSRVFARTNTNIATEYYTPTGGDYEYPWPGGENPHTHNGVTWHDGVPAGKEILWSSVCTFFGAGGSSGWSTPSPETDTASLDIEFAFLQDPDEEPDTPSNNNRHGCVNPQQNQVWFDPILDTPLPSWCTETWSDMVWRAERETINGVQGAWVITRIKGEKGEIDPSSIPPELIKAIVDEAAKALKDGVSIMINPQNIVVKQESVGQITFTGSNADVEVFRSDAKVPFYLSDATAYGKTDQGAYTSMTNCASVSGGSTATTSTKTVNLIGVDVTYNQETGEYEYAYDNGYIKFKVNIPFTDPDTQQTTTTSYWMKVAWYLNRLGNRIVKTMGDIETTYMTRREYSLNDSTTNLLRGTKNPTIGSGGESTDTWNDEGDSNLTVVNLSDDDTPVQGYDKAFKVATTSHSFYQLGTFWSNIATYRFSAYVKAIGSNQTAKIYMSQPVQGGGGFERTFNVGTTWQLVTFDVKVSNYSSTIGTAIFYLGMTSNGAIEYIAPTLIDITDTSVVKTDYEGKIQSSAEGITSEFTQILTDPVNGYVQTKDVGNYVETAIENSSTIQHLEEDVEQISTIKQTSDEISLRVSNTTKENLIVNGTFSGSSGTVPQSWNKLGNDVAINTTYKYNDNNSVRIGQSDATATSGISQSLWYHSSTDSSLNIERAVPGEWHVLKFVARKYSPTSGNMFRVWFGSSLTDDYTSSDPFVVELTDSWKEYSLQMKAKDPITTVDSNINVLFQTMKKSGDDYAADVLLADVRMTARMDGLLKEAGIDIGGGRVDVLADNFTVKNNEGEQTLGLDSDGNFEVSGTIKAYNLYRNLCIITGWQSEYTGSQSIYYSSNWYYCNGSSDETERYGYEEGKYYENPLTYDFMVQCTYAADIISLRNNAANDWPSGGIICIPRPQDFPGKTIEIRHNATNGGGSAVLRACDGSLAFADFQYSNQGVESFLASYPVVSQSVASYDTMSLYSYYFNGNYYWRIVGLIHGGGITRDINGIHYEYGLAKRTV